ncbi:hypothetical protein [Streptomyces sp. NBC_01235]|uniref:hypothetical protein n=1 Tax=Streptomyces sp. NBC_01235 TaxID=2903788 RepID=UPI003FA3BDCA
MAVPGPRDPTASSRHRWDCTRGWWRLCAGTVRRSTALDKARRTSGRHSLRRRLGYRDWSHDIAARLTDHTGVTPDEPARTVTASLVERPLFCDLLTHVTLSLEREVTYGRVHAFKTVALANAGDLVDAIACALNRAPTSRATARSRTACSRRGRVSYRGISESRLAVQDQRPWACAAQHQSNDHFIPSSRWWLEARPVGPATAGSCDPDQCDQNSVPCPRRGVASGTTGPTRPVLPTRATRRGGRLWNVE